MIQSDQRHVLIAATHPLQCTGYARVGATLANGLAERGHRVSYWGYQNLAPASGRTVHPGVNVLDVGARTGDAWGFGEAQLPETVAALGCDTVVLYNDVMVVNAFLDAFARFREATPDAPRPKVVAYIDLVHDDEDAALVHAIATRVDEVWVFAPHWRDALATRYPDRIVVRVVPHGVDAGLLEAGDGVTRDDARDALKIPRDAFVVVNTNRNSYRKALDLTIDGFLRFWKTRRDSVLVLNNNERIESGYDINAIVLATCRRLGIADTATVLNAVVLRIPNGGFMPDDILARLHKAADVGVNTCLGEGFGLCQLEGACLGVPQIATKTGGLADILDDAPPHVLLEPVVHMTLPRGFVLHSGTLDVPDPRDLERALHDLSDPETRLATADRAGHAAALLRQRYDWTAILDDVATYV